MVGIFKMLFSSPPPPFDAHKEAAYLLATLPPCAPYVVIASPQYSPHYRCEVIMRADALIAYADNARTSTFGGSYESQAVREAFPTWLRRAAPTGNNVSYLSPAFFEEVRAYILDFIHDGSASVHCPDCGVAVEVTEDQSGYKSYGPEIEPTSEWTSTWKCPQGHVLYCEDHKVRMHLSPRA